MAMAFSKNWSMSPFEVIPLKVRRGPSVSCQFLFRFLLQILLVMATGGSGLVVPGSLGNVSSVPGSPDRDSGGEREGVSTHLDEVLVFVRTFQRKLIQRARPIPRFQLDKLPQISTRLFRMVHQGLPWTFKAHLLHNGIGRPLNS